MYTGFARLDDIQFRSTDTKMNQMTMTPPKSTSSMPSFVVDMMDFNSCLEE